MMIERAWHQRTFLAPVRTAAAIVQSVRPKYRTDRSEAATAPCPLKISEDGAVRARASQIVVIESCHSTWLFDETNHRFRRMVKGPRIDRSVSTDWRPYDHLIIDDHTEAFIVFLDVAGTRLLRSWRHLQDCDRCGGEATAEMSIEELQRAVAN